MELVSNSPNSVFTNSKMRMGAAAASEKSAIGDVAFRPVSTKVSVVPAEVHIENCGRLKVTA